MGDQQTEKGYEENRLRQTLDLAKKQLEQAKADAERKKSEILAEKRDAGENATHGITDLCDSADFEAIVELSQYRNAIVDKIVSYEEGEHKIRLLENMIRSPYFARIDFQFDGEDEFEKIYIGRSSLKKDGGQEMVVYDWRSPIAGVFYRFMTGKAFYDAPVGRITGEVGLKRQYEIQNGILEYFFDADVQIVDEFLRQLLSRNTTAKMKAIVETIQREQDVVIRDMETDLLMVQGVAGSGKTSIALHRAAYLMYQGLQAKLSANNIMIVSPNSVFEQYISDVLPELGEDNVVSAVFEDFLGAIIKEKKIQPRNEFLEKMLVRSRDREITKDSMEFKTSQRFREMLDRFALEIPQRWIEFEDVFYEGKYVVGGKTLKNKISGRTETPLGIKLEQLEDYIMELLFGAGKGRGNYEEKNPVRQNIQKFIKLDVIGLYKTLFTDQAYFYSLLQGDEAAEGTESTERTEATERVNTTEAAERIEKIRAYTEKNLQDARLSYDDAVALAYLYLKLYGAGEYRNIKQVVIDEAQDYYPLQYEIFGLLFPNAKFTVLGDVNQTVAKREELSLYEQIQNILNKKKSSLTILDKSFRCTNEILTFSLNFIERSPKIKSFNRKGDDPKVVTANSPKDYIHRLVEEVELCREKGFRSIGLLCKTEANAACLFQKIRSETDVELIRNGSIADLQGAFIMPIYMAKGLEFDAVLICDADSGNYYDEDDQNLLYVGCTRALHRLGLFCEKEISPLIRTVADPIFY